MVVRGGTSLRLHLPLPQLNTILDTAFALFQSDAYKKIWPEIDHITPVKDEAVLSRLDARLDSDLAAGIAQKNLVMFTPAHRRDELIEVDSYVFGRMAKSPVTRPYLTIASWLTFLAEHNRQPSVAEARQSPIHLLNEAKDEVKVWTAYDCFGYEATVDQQQFVLSSGIWYEVVPSFISRINAVVKGIKPPTIVLPSWNQTDCEGTYNAGCSKALRLLLFDAKNIRLGGGQSQFEFCDLLDLKSQTLFFAKIASKSSGMSHLLEQVRRTAELLFSTDSGYTTSRRLPTVG